MKTQKLERVQTAEAQLILRATLPIYAVIRQLYVRNADALRAMGVAKLNKRMSS